MRARAKFGYLKIWIFWKCGYLKENRKICEMWIFRYVDNFAIRIYWLFEYFEIRISWLFEYFEIRISWLFEYFEIEILKNLILQ